MTFEEGGTQMPSGYGPPMPQAGNANPFQGVPFRGPQMDVRQDDPEHMQPVCHHDPHLKTFDFSKQEDIDAYQEVLFKVTKGSSTIGFKA